MITITAYTEYAGSFAAGAGSYAAGAGSYAAGAGNFAVSGLSSSKAEQLQLHESTAIAAGEETEEQSSFEQLLAGMLQDASPEDNFDDNAAAVEKNKEGDNLNLFAGSAIFAAAESGVDFKDHDIDLPDFAVDKEHQFFNMENAGSPLNVFSEIAAIEEELIDAPEFDDGSFAAGARILNLISETDAKTELPSAAKYAETKPVAYAHNAVHFSKEAVQEAAGKKAGENQPPAEALFKNSNTEAASKISSAAENSGLFNRQEEKSGNFEKNLNGEKSVLTDTPSRYRKDKISLDVRDMRTAAGGADANNHITAADANKIPGPAEITLDLRLPDFGPSSQAQTSWDVKAGNALENMLARELHQNFNGDIVRHASMALRDGGAGTIRIALHPETLGNIKIHLEMAENKITGLILVESQEALNAFRKEIAALEQAFRDSGFADASLDLSLTADGSGAENQELEDSSLARQIAASSYEDSYESETTPVIDVFFGRETGSVNMLV